MNHTVARYSLENLVEIELKKQKKLSDPAVIKEELHRTLQKLKVLDKECTKLKMAMDRTKNAEVLEILNPHFIMDFLFVESNIFQDLRNLKIKPACNTLNHYF